MNETELEDLVPPPEECRAAYEAGVIGDDTALVWFMWEQQSGDVYGRLVPREMKDEFAGVLPAIMAVLRKDVPAPTLAELLAMLLGNCPWIEKHEMKNPVEYVVHGSRFTGSAHSDHGSERDTNPAAAALRLLVRVKQGEVKNAND